MKEIDIVPQLYHILAERLAVNPALLIEQNNDKPLTGSPFWLTDLMLTYFFFEVEQSFGISIDASLTLDYGFNSISKVAEIVKKTVGNGFEFL